LFFAAKIIKKVTKRTRYYFVFFNEDLNKTFLFEYFLTLICNNSSLKVYCLQLYEAKLKSKKDALRNGFYDNNFIENK